MKIWGGFALSRRPFRLDLNASLTASCVVAKAAPLPVLRAFTQPVLYRIAMNVAQHFHKPRVITNIEIVISPLPEMLFPNQAKRGLEWPPTNAYATRFVQNGQKLRRQHRRPPLRKTKGWGTLDVLD
jgi:hypothetical protein